MDSVVGIFQAIFALYGAWWGYSYYTGRINFSGEQEERRQKRVKKYGAILIISVIACVLGGSVLLIMKILELAGVIQ
jgi:hypothetical protein